MHCYQDLQPWSYVVYVSQDTSFISAAEYIHVIHVLFMYVHTVAIHPMSTGPRAQCNVITECIVTYHSFHFGYQISIMIRKHLFIHENVRKPFQDTREIWIATNSV